MIWVKVSITLTSVFITGMLCGITFDRWQNQQTHPMWVPSWLTYFRKRGK